MSPIDMIQETRKKTEISDVVAAIVKKRYFFCVLSIMGEEPTDTSNISGDNDDNIDFDNDGIRDIVNNPIDAIGSVANFLSRKGKWSPNKPIAFKAKLKGDEPQIKSAFKPYMSKRELESLGIFSEQTIPMGQLVVPVKLLLETGWEYRIGFDNYYSLSRYNRSKLYVMAVSDFSDEISKFFKE